MGYTYTRIDGERVEVHVAAAFRKMEAAFKKKFGLGLIVASGTRTRAEQAALYARYKAGTGNLAAYPGTSNHEEYGPRGPRALDIWDTGRDAGVTVAGTTRAKWLRKNGPKYGFNPAGYGFSRVEPWHYEFTGSLTGAVASTPSEEDELNAEEKKQFDEMAKTIKEINRRVHVMTGKALGHGFWKIGNRGKKLDVLFNDWKWGEKGVRNHGTGSAFLVSELGAQKIFRAEQRGKGDPIDVEELAETLAPLLSQAEAGELAEAVVRKVGAALSDEEK